MIVSGGYETAIERLHAWSTAPSSALHWADTTAARQGNGFATSTACDRKSSKCQSMSSAPAIAKGALGALCHRYGFKARHWTEILAYRGVWGRGDSALLPARPTVAGPRHMHLRSCARLPGYLSCIIEA